MIENVVLVNFADEEIGLMEKMQAHKEARLHRAFSVFLWNDKNELLLQQRQLDKYHCGGLWTNTCCSHPRVGETLTQAVARRLQEELHIVCETEWMYSFIYKADLGDGLYEHEFDHVFFGRFSEPINPNPQEVLDWKYVSIADIQKDLALNTAQYTPWFKIIFAEVMRRELLTITP